MRIVHLTNPSPVGGLERVVSILSRGLIKRGHEVTVVAVLNSGVQRHPFVDLLASEKVPVRVLPIAARSYLREHRLVHATLLELAADVAHTHGYRSDVVHGSAARRARVPQVSTVHGFTGGGIRNRFYERLQLGALRRADAAIAVTQPIVDRLREMNVAADHIHLVPNAYQANGELLDRGAAKAALGLSDDAFHVGWVGRLSGEKGPDVMLAALALAPSDRVHVSFIGEGPLRDSLIARARDLGLAGRAHFHGAVAGASSLFSAFDAIALTSHTEGTPMVLLEAMAAGVPIIASRVGGVPSLLTAEDAILVPPGRPESVAEGIDRMQRDPLLRERLAGGAAARLRRDFDFQRWIARYDAIYAQVVAGEGSA